MARIVNNLLHPHSMQYCNMEVFIVNETRPIEYEKYEVFLKTILKKIYSLNSVEYNVIYKKKIDFDFDKKIKNPEWWKNFNNFMVNINGMMIFFIKCKKKIKQRVLKIDGKSV